MFLPQIYAANRRRIWSFLNIIWNKVDTDRIKEVGPDRACAEWLMRNGAFVKWEEAPEYLKDYNALPPEKERHFIKEIDATNSSIMHMGFPHLKGCSYIKLIKLHSCPFIDNKALEQLEYVKKSLEYLQVSSCGDVADAGIMSLRRLSSLKSVLLYDLPEVKNKDHCIHTLRTSLPSCEVDFPYAQALSKKESPAP